MYKLSKKMATNSVRSKSKWHLSRIRIRFSKTGSPDPDIVKMGPNPQHMRNEHEKKV